MTLTIIGSVALDTLAIVRNLAAPETTGGIERVSPDLCGGTGGNVAMALARLGAAPRLLASVGSDFAGSAYERALAEAGVDITCLVRSQGGPTARAYVFVREDGHAQMTYFYGGAPAELRLPPHAAPLGRAHFSAGDISQYPRLMEQADWVSFDPGQEVHHRPLPEIVACLPHVDLLFLNQHEREVLERDASLPLGRLFDHGIATIVETRGTQGTVVHTPTGQAAQVSAATARARDPTGAGDAHRAGFLYALERGADLATCARLASIMGASAVEAVGAQVGLPTLDEARERYQKMWSEQLPF